MPNIDLISVPLYSPTHTYHWEYDNLPLQSLILREELINSAVDINANLLRLAAGTQGSVANRIDQSIDEDGDLKIEAVDDILHSIGAHTDGEFDGIDYVRMLSSERAKLSLIADEATNLTLQIETPSNVVLFEEGAVIIEPSTSITWQVIGENRIRANLAFPIEAAHRHYCDLTPVMVADYQDYKVNSSATPYIEGSLKVFINGIRLSSTDSIYVPAVLPTEEWTLNSYTEDAENGLFDLQNAITSDDVIRIDFDILLS